MAVQAEKLRRILTVGVVLWSVLVAVSLWLSISIEDSRVERLTREMAFAHLSQLVVTRQWNTEHNGVYVFADENNRPNEYLKDPERDIQLPDGRVLTKINPAYMTRQLSELSSKTQGFRFRMTSLRPISPANAPTPWERGALLALEGGAAEVHDWFEEEGGREYRVMSPLRSLPECVRCHEKSGEKVGEVRGGISITLLDPPDIDHGWTIFWHALIGLAGASAVTALGLKLLRIYEKVELDSLIDPLTGVYNRRQFMDRLTLELRAAHRNSHTLGVIMLDIDHFKLYNDRFGHLEGDRCLKAVARIVSGALKRPQDLAARFGGEEFVAMLPQTTAGGVARVAERIRADVEALGIPHPRNDGHGVVTISIGTALYQGRPEDPFPGEVLTNLLNGADEALYRAKDGGRNRIAEG